MAATASFLSSDLVQIGGGLPGQGNVVSGNQVYGIYLYTGNSNYIQGNYIGTDVTGQVPMGNTYDGISLDGTFATLVGGTNAGQGNVIDANGTDGIALGRYASSSNVMIFDNLIGVPASSSTPLPLGVAIPSGHFQHPVPNTPPSYCNGGNCIEANLVSDDCPPRNIIWGNTLSTCGNANLYINTGTFQPPVNTFYNPAGNPVIVSPGPQLPASLSQLTYSGGILSGTIAATGPASSTLNVNLFSSDNLSWEFHPIGSTTVTTGSSGSTTTPITLPTTSLLFPFVTAVITDPCGNISTMSALAPVTVPPPVYPGTTMANFPWSGYSGCPVSTFTGELFDLPAPDLFRRRAAAPSASSVTTPPGSRATVSSPAISATTGSTISKCSSPPLPPMLSKSSPNMAASFNSPTPVPVTP